MHQHPRSVYIAFEAFPRPKGASTHIAAMVQALARDHAPVLLLCLGYADMPPLQWEDGIIIRRCKMYHPNLLRRAKEFGDFVYRTLTGLSQPPELCVFRDPWGGWPALSALPQSASVFEVNALPSWELSYTYPHLAACPSLLAKIEHTERFCLHRCHRVITVSELTAGALASLDVSPGKISVVPNSADDLFFRDRSDEAASPLLTTGRWLGYFGSLHCWQGVDLLIDAWALVASGCPDVRLLVVHNGNRPAVRVLEKRVAKRGLEGRVLLHPPLPPERLAAVVSTLEFTTAPLLETSRNTVQGCCPVKIVESMAAGTPVLASDLRVCRDLIRHGEDGYLAPPGDVRSWAMALRRLLSERRLTEQLGREANLTAKARFTRTGMYARLDVAFRAAMSGAGFPAGLIPTAHNGRLESLPHDRSSAGY